MWSTCLQGVECECETVGYKRLNLRVCPWKKHLFHCNCKGRKKKEEEEASSEAEI